MTGYATGERHIEMKLQMAIVKVKEEMYAVSIAYIINNGKGGIFTNE